MVFSLCLVYDPVSTNIFFFPQTNIFCLKYTFGTKILFCQLMQAAEGCLVCGQFASNFEVLSRTLQTHMLVKCDFHNKNEYISPCYFLFQSNKKVLKVTCFTVQKKKKMENQKILTLLTLTCLIWLLSPHYLYTDGCCEDSLNLQKTNSLKMFSVVSSSCYNGAKSTF